MPETVVKPATNGLAGAGFSGGGFEIPQLEGMTLVAQFAEAADTIPLWGTAPGTRDRALRAFWPGEPIFASALLDTVAKYAAFGWSLEGGPRTVAAMQDVLHGADQGAGWIPMISKVLIDLYTQDNGAFIEVVRADRTPISPVTAINHLDSGRCVRTGDPMNPVVYYDIEGQGHLMPYYTIVVLSEMPSPDERMRGVQFCALTRCLRMAQIMRDIQVYKREKISGRFVKQIHLVSGMSTKLIDDALLQHQAAADNRGLVRMIQPLVLGTLDPTAKVDHVAIDLAGLPDGYDEEVTMRWYITQLAMSFGTDYSDFAPLHGAAGRTASTQTNAQMRSRGKGPQLFMRTLEHALNWHGVLPKNVRFKFGEQDYAASIEKYQALKEYAVALQIAVEMGALTPQVARQMLADEGYLPQVYLDLMRDPDPTDQIVQAGSDRIEPQPTVEPGVPGPITPPQNPTAGGGTGPVGAPSTPNRANSNLTANKPNTQSQRPTAGVQ
jgi:hypothetical protein